MEGIYGSDESVGFEEEGLAVGGWVFVGAMLVIVWVGCLGGMYREGVGQRGYDRQAT